MFAACSLASSRIFTLTHIARVSALKAPKAKPTTTGAAAPAEAPIQSKRVLAMSCIVPMRLICPAISKYLPLVAIPLRASNPSEAHADTGNGRATAMMMYGESRKKTCAAIAAGLGRCVFVQSTTFLSRRRP